eukprot:14267188-Heterocapsa_arctica.AAC.1
MLNRAATLSDAHRWRSTRSRPELSPDQQAQDQAMRTAHKGHPMSNVPVRLPRTLVRPTPMH